MELDEIKDKCMDSEGYVTFSAYYTGAKDKQENPIIEFQYRRHHFSLEEAKNAVGQFRKFIDDELQRLIELGEEDV